MELNLLLLIVSFVVLLCLGMPVAFVIGAAGMAFFAATPDLPFSIVAQRIVAQTQSYSFLAVPFFIFAGGLMNESGITSRILKFAQTITRRMWGGTAQISVVMSTIMGGVSGSATADAAMETRLLGPEMTKRGYSKGYIIAVNSLTAMITATIPPSLGLIIYGFVGEVSIGRLFVAGIVPGILMMIFLMVTTTITAKKRGYDAPDPNAPKVTFKELAVGVKMNTSLISVILISAGGAQATYIFLCRGFVASLPKELDEAATIDGCTFFQTYVLVILPLLKPVMATVALLSFRGGWNEYILPLVFTMTNDKLRPLTVGVNMLKNAGDGTAAWDIMFAGATISIVPILVVYCCFSRFFMNGMTAGAVKG